MTTFSEQLLNDMVKVIVREVDPQEIILFGSYARNQAVQDSDLDFLIVDLKPFGPGRSRRQQLGLLYRALARFRIPHDILIYSRDEIESWRGSINHIISRALREGKVLYERAQ